MSPATGTTTTRPRPTARSRASLRALLLGGLGALIALALLAPPHARADAYLGSTLLLHHAPDAPEPVAIDSVFWLTALASDTPALKGYVVSQPGQIQQFQLRGYAGGGVPAPIHFQDLRPSASGALTIVASSQAYALPATDGVWSYDPQNFCVQAGDYLGFNEQGGAPINVFGAIAGSTTERFSATGGTMNGDVVTPTALPNVELLMAAYEGTGPHASPLCGGIAGVELHVSTRAVAVHRSGAAALALACTGPLSCAGTLTVNAVQPAQGGQPARSVVVAQAPFSLASRGRRDIVLAVSALGRRLLSSAHGHLAATVVASLGAASADTVSAAVTLTG